MRAPLRRALQLAELAGMRDERRLRRAEQRRQHRVGLAELVGGVDEIGGGAQRRRGADRGQDRGDAVGVREDALAGRQLAADDQRRREGARARDLVAAARPVVLRVEEADDRRRRLGRRRCGLHGAAGATTTRLLAGTPARRDLVGATIVGAWPTPANSCTRAFGPRAAIAAAVAGVRTSESAPRRTSVGQRIAS
jgi:hypothetical protein